MLKSEEEIRKMYRSYIELWAQSDITKKTNIETLHGAILAYGRVLGFNLKKIDKDMKLAKNKYQTIYH